MRRFQARLPTSYGEQTYASPYWIVRFPHQIRLRTAVKAVLAHRPDVLLDYGAGEGHLIFDAIERGFAGRILAYEPVERYRSEIVADAQRRGLTDRIEIVSARHELHGPFDFVTCLGVLEHMPLPERESFYDLCRMELSGARARALIDVPVEVGPTLLVKSLARQVLKGRDREYSWGALLRYAAGAKMYDPGRHDPADTRTWILNHKGFDYRLLEQEILERGFRITARQSTPIGWLPAPWLNQERFLTLSL